MLNITNLTKLYGEKKAIDDLTLHIQPGEIFGFIGHNGAGKTTFNMVQNLVSTFLGRIPATWLLSRLPGTNLFLIGCAAPASTILSIIMLGIYIWGGYWKKGLYND